MNDYCMKCANGPSSAIPLSDACFSCTSDANGGEPSKYISKEAIEYLKADVETAQELHKKALEYLIMFGNEPILRHAVIANLKFEPNYTGKMPPERFQELLDELDGNSLQTLKEKNARYSSDGDSLHNFRSGADVAGGTPAQACWGYMTKHLVALRDMVMNNDFSNREDFLEKCQDTINYVRFLWCIGNDELDKNNKGENLNVK